VAKAIGKAGATNQDLNMNEDINTSDTADLEQSVTAVAVSNDPQTPAETTEITKPPGSYVKHAMRNMVRKRSKSLQHFFLSTAGLLGLFVALAYLTK
jgi:Protein of unknown function (DUF3285)